MRYAPERRSLDESIEELHQIADGRNDIFGRGRRHHCRVVVCLAVHPRFGYELIGAGMLILAGGGR